MAKVSIIVPIYNVEKYVAKCLDSLSKQTFKDIEIWAISDGSPDNSVNIVREYANNDNRIKCIEKENGGYGSVLEYAIQNIKTDYFLICDPDDWISDDAIEILYNAAIKNNLDLVMANHYEIYEDTTIKSVSNVSSYPNVFVPKFEKVYTQANGLDKFLFLLESPHAKLYKTALAKDIKFPYKVSYTDSLLFMLFVLRAKRAMCLEKSLAYYLIEREGNTMTDVNPKIADYYHAVFTSIVSQYEQGSNKNQYFYYRMFLKFIRINIYLAKISDKKVYNKKRRLFEELLKICLKHRNEIKPFLKYETKRTQLAYKLYLNPITSKFIYIYFSNKIYKSIH